MSAPLPKYPIIDVGSWPVIGDEMMGTKPKCWLVVPGHHIKWLFKQKSRPQSEDDWSEKIACKLAGLLGVPHATVELAKRKEQRGVILRDLVAECGAEELIPGNSLLVEEDPDYPGGKTYRVAQHTVERVFWVLTNRSIGLLPGLNLGQEVTSSCDLFTGYLLLDAWIGNTDRHHENWAVMKMPDARLVLSPSYDHASSLGHNLQDDDREERLTTRDRNRSLAAFVAKAKSAFYRTPSDRKAVPTDEAFRLACEFCPSAGSYWLGRLGNLDNSLTTDIVNAVPDGLMSEVAKQFTLGMIRANRSRLLALNP